MCLTYEEFQLFKKIYPKLKFRVVSSENDSVIMFEIALGDKLNIFKPC